MDEAIDLAIAEESPYPEKAMFIDVDMPYTDRELKLAARFGLTAVLVSADGAFRTVPPKSAVA